MIKQTEQDTLDLVSKNLWTPIPTVCYQFHQPMFVSPNGLLSDFSNLYVGNHALWKQQWESATHSVLTGSVHVPALVSIPCPAECWTSLSDWVLYCLPKAIAVRSSVSDPVPEFLVPSVPTITDFLHDCRWPDKHITTVPYMEDVQYYSQHVYAYPPAEHYRVTKEDVDRLRSLLPPAQKAKAPVLTIGITEDGLLTRGWVEETLSCVFPRDSHKRWDVRVISAKTPHKVLRKAFQEADWVVGEGAFLNWMWMCRPGTHVLEFMGEGSITSKRIHLAGAADLVYVASLVRKEPVEFQRQHAMLEMGKAIQTFGFKESLDTLVDPDETPVVVLPTGHALEGVWSHTGDTFREMATMWAERGYCKIQTSEDTPYCWWGGLGEVLLYDRPTPRWWPEQSLPSYQMALFGNCSPPGPAEHRMKQSVWGFWPRSPRSLEAHVAEGIPGWSERPVASLFLGRVENGVQKKHRCDMDWAGAVERFSMPLDSTGAAYPFTQTEYLTQLTGAKFGLCLAGYGKKCNREIEYMACGTVPLVAPDVDMTHYLVAPKEGVHYFRVHSPADVQRLVESTSQETWEAMSRACHKWWRHYASCEGLFRLTWARIEQCRPYFHVGIPTVFRPNGV
jgi:hypothetical protein